MTDFVDVLEQQLVAAHGRRQRFVPPWRAGIVLVAAGAAAAVIVAVVIGLASPDAQRGATPPAQQSTPPTTTAPQGDTSVAVLNATTVTGLGRAVADKLSGSGFRIGVVRTAITNTSRVHSTIYYAPDLIGLAEAVASCLEIPADRVVHWTPAMQAAGDGAGVVVALGADKAR